MHKDRDVSSTDSGTGSLCHLSSSSLQHSGAFTIRLFTVWRVYSGSSTIRFFTVWRVYSGSSSLQRSGAEPNVMTIFCAIPSSGATLNPYSGSLRHTGSGSLFRAAPRSTSHSTNLYLPK